MTIEKRHPTINGNDYYVKIVEKKRKKRVSVYNDEFAVRLNEAFLYPYPQ